MDTTQEILTNFDAWEILIIKATFLISLVTFCSLHILKTIKDLKKCKRKGSRNRK